MELSMDSICNSEIYKILLIEDNPDYCQLIHDQLIYDKTTEFILQNTDRVSSGIQMLKDEEFDVVLLDLLLPDAKELEALERIVNFKHDVPVIILTAVGDERLAFTALQKGAEDYLIKGKFETALLIRSIHYAIKRKEAALSVREIEEKYRTLFETTMEGIIISDIEGRILLGNPAAASILGYESVDELKKSRMTDHYTDSVQREKIIRELKLKGHLDNIEIDGRKKDGTKVIALTSLIAHNDNEGNLLNIEGVFRDITARKRSEEALQQKTHELEERVKKLNCLYGLSQLIGDSSRSSEDVINQVLYIISKAWQYPESTYVRIELNGKIFKTKNYKETPWSQSRDIIISGQRAGVIEVGYLKEMPVIFEGPFLKEERDLIDALARQIATFQQRIEVDEELRREETRYWQLVNSLSDIAFSLSPNGIITSMNPAFEKLTGWSRDEFIDKPFLNLIHPDDLPLVISGFESLSNGGKPSNIDVHLKTKSGSELIVEGKVTPHIEAGELIGYFGVAHDITERKHMIDALKESEDRFRVLSNSTFEMIAIHDQGTVIDINNQLLNAFGYTREEIIGTNFFNLLTPETRSIAMKYAREGYEEPFEIVGSRKNKTTFSLQTQARLIPYKGRIVSVIVGRDLSERKQTEKALRDSEERLRIFMDSATVSFSLWDSQLNLVDTNKKSLELFHPPETKKEDIIGKSMFELSPELEKTGRYKAYLEVIKSGIPFKTEELVIHHKYSNRHLSLEVFKVGNGIGVIATDVTKLILAEKDIKEANKRFEHILASNPAIIYSAEPKGENQTTYMSDNVRRITGYEPKDFIKKPSFWVKKLHPKDRTRVRDTFKQEIAEKGYFEGVYRFQHKDGTYQWMLEEARLITDNQGNPQEIIGYWSDITEQKNIEKEFQRSELKYQNLIDNMVDILVETNSDAIITFISPQVTDILAYSPEELIGKSSLDFVYPNDLESVVNALTNTGDLILEVGLKHKDGHFVPFSILGRSVQVDGTTKLVGVLRDITEQKKADESLSRERQNFYKILNSTDDAIYIINSQHEVEFINTATEKEFGPVNGKKCYEYFNKFSEACSWCTLEEVMNGETIRRERTLERNQKTYDMIDTPYISPNGEISSLAILRDITDRRKAEEALRESEEKYRSFIENFQGIAFQGYEDFSAGFFLGKVKEITGYSAENFSSGQVMFDQLIHPEDIQWVTEDVEKFISSPQKATQREYRIIDKNGSIHWIHETIQKYYDEKKKKGGVYGTFQDITERKKIEKGLKLSEEKYRTLFESAPDFILLIDSSGKIIDCNDAVDKVLERRKEELLGKSFIDTGMIYEADRAKYVELFMDALSGLRAGPIETRTKGNEGQTRYYEIYPSLFKQDDKVQAIQVIGHEITERKQAEEALRESEEKFRILAEQSLLGICIAQDNRIEYINEAYANIFGYTVDEMYSWEIEDVEKAIHPKDREIPLDQLRKKQEGSQDVIVDYEYRGIRKTGEIIWVHSYSKTIILNGKTADFVTIIDITEKKQVEEEVKKSKELLEKTFDSLDSAVFVLDSNKPPLILDCNPAATKIFGYEKQEMLNMPTKLLHEDDKALNKFQKIIYPLIAQKGFLNAFEFKMKRKTGDIFPTEHYISQLFDEENKRIGWISVVRDITRQKNAEREIREREEMYRNLVTNLTDTVIELDAEVKFRYLSPQCIDLLGYAPEEVIGKNGFDFIHPDDLEAVTEAYEKALTGEHIFEFEYRGKHKAGHDVWLSASGRMVEEEEDNIKLVIIAKNIDERKRAEKALRTSEERFRQLVDTSPDGILLTDFLGDISLINKAGASILGYKDEYDLITTNIFDLVVSEDQENALRSIKETLKTGVGTQLEFKFLRKDSKQIPVEMSTTIIEEPVEGTNLFLAIIRDVTDRKERMRQLQESEERFRKIFEEGSFGMILLDLNLSYIKINDYFCKMVGYTEQELTRLTYLKILHPDDVERDKQNIEKLVYGEISRYRTEEQYIKKNGDQIWVHTTVSLICNDNGDPLHLILMVEDISQRKRAEEKMRKQLMKFNIVDGYLYLVTESYPSISRQVFIDLIRLGYSGLAISRVPRKEFERDIDVGFNFLWFSEVEEPHSISPNLMETERIIKALHAKAVIWIDRLDYLISKNGFKSTLQSVFKLREIAYLNNLVVLLSVDPDTLPKQYIHALKKETKPIEPRFLVKVPDDLLKVLRIVYQQNDFGTKPSYTEIGNELEISKPTIRKRVRELMATGYLNEQKSGNRKILELTEKGLLLFRKEKVSY
ncbi:MAG: PAS domain S-box protein [Candidatus Thorarchaeota archaeon]